MMSGNPHKVFCILCASSFLDADGAYTLKAYGQRYKHQGRTKNAADARQNQTALARGSPKLGSATKLEKLNRHCKRMFPKTCSD